MKSLQGALELLKQKPFQKRPVNVFEKHFSDVVVRHSPFAVRRSSNGFQHPFWRQRASKRFGFCKVWKRATA